MGVKTIILNTISQTQEGGSCHIFLLFMKPKSHDKKAEELLEKWKGMEAGETADNKKVVVDIIKMWNICVSEHQNKTHYSVELIGANF